MDKYDYIIDFERVNELTTTKLDNPKEGWSGTFYFSTSRKLINDYLKIFNNFNDNDELKYVIDSLLYNKILTTRGLIRETRITQILNDV